MQRHPEENQIIELFNQGATNEAFKLLVAQYGNSLYQLIRRLTKSHELTNDVLQNVFVKVFQNLEGFKRESNLFTWLYRIARNESLNFIEKENRRAGIDLDPAIIEIKAGHALLEQIDGDQISAMLEEAIETLPEKQAIVFQLKYFEELTYQEISKKLNTSEGALKANYFHARQKIEEFLLKQLNH